MSFVLYKCILTKNDCYKKHTPMTPKGVVVHSTGANNPNLKRYVQPDDGILGTNKNNNDWNRSGVEKCVHAFIGYDKNKEVKCYQTLPFDIACWGCGGGKKGSFNYNPQGHIQFEMCEDGLTNEDYFNKVFDTAAEFCAYLCKTYNLKVDSIVSHQEAAKLGYASNHNDPSKWLKNFGKDMNWFRSLVNEKLNGGQPTKNYKYVDNVDYEGLVVRDAKTNLKTGSLLTIGTRVEVLKTVGIKAYITDNTYVNKNYLSDKKPSLKTVKGALGGLNVRKKPSVFGKKITTLANGTKVKIYATKGKWSKVSPDEEAWCSSNYLK